MLIAFDTYAVKEKTGARIYRAPYHFAYRPK